MIYYISKLRFAPYIQSVVHNSFVNINDYLPICFFSGSLFGLIALCIVPQTFELRVMSAIFYAAPLLDPRHKHKSKQKQKSKPEMVLSNIVFVPLAKCRGSTPTWRKTGIKIPQDCTQSRP
jgi:hypothetical protein